MEAMVPPVPLQMASDSGTGSASAVVIAGAVGSMILVGAVVGICFRMGFRCFSGKGNDVRRIPLASAPPEFSNLFEAKPQTGADGLNCSSVVAKPMGSPRGGPQDSPRLPSSPEHDGADFDDEDVLAIPCSKTPELLVSPSNILRFLGSPETAGRGKGLGADATASAGSGALLATPEDEEAPATVRRGSQHPPSSALPEPSFAEPVPRVSKNCDKPVSPQHGGAEHDFALAIAEPVDAGDEPTVVPVPPPDSPPSAQRAPLPPSTAAELLLYDAPPESVLQPPRAMGATPSPPRQRGTGNIQSL